MPARSAVFVYREPFERYRLRELADAVPELAEALLAIDRRLVDLLPIVRNHVHHPEFGGSFSIKAAVPVLCTGGGWDELEIPSGDRAAADLQALPVALDAVSDEERARRRTALLAYCERDTHAMVAPLRELKALAQPRGWRPVGPIGPASQARAILGRSDRGYGDNHLQLVPQ